MVFFPNKIGGAHPFRWWDFYQLQVRRRLEPITIAGITSKFWLNWWTEPETDITPDREEATTTSTTETKVLEIYAFKTYYPLNLIFIPWAVQYKCRPGIHGDGTNTVYLTKIEFEFGVIHEEKDKLIPIHSRTVNVNISTTSTTYVDYYVITEMTPFNKDLIYLMLNRLYYKIALYGYVDGGTGYFSLDVRMNQPHNMIRIIAYRVMSTLDNISYSVERYWGIDDEV